MVMQVDDVDVVDRAISVTADHADVILVANVSRVSVSSNNISYGGRWVQRYLQIRSSRAVRDGDEQYGNERER